MTSNFCVCCGVEIPEGRQVCWNCEHGYYDLTQIEEKVEEKQNDY